VRVAECYGLGIVGYSAAMAFSELGHPALALLLLTVTSLIALARFISRVRSIPPALADL